MQGQPDGPAARKEIMEDQECEDNGNGPCEGEVYDRVPLESITGMPYAWCDRHAKIHHAEAY
jgi:hypothetical protein